jgi:ABC-type Fe3+/spermidine/putrescine transport system ATPase subunit
MSLQAEAISKRSKTKWVLRDVSFKAAEGEIFGIFGQSGSGKSSLLKVLGGLEKADGGRVIHFSSASAGAKQVLYLGSTPKSGWFNALRQVFTDRSTSGRNEIQKVDQALLSDTRLLLLDDVFCGLNREQKEAAFERIRAIVREKWKIVIFGTSNFEEVLWLCDRSAVLSRGEVLQIGTPEELYLFPASSAAAVLTGRCNDFQARRLSSNNADVPEFQTIDGRHRLTTGRTEKARLGALNRNVNLAIRPEHVSISFGASFPEDNLLKAVVIGVKFLGPATLVKLDAAGLEVDALVMRLVGLKPGDECMIGVPPDRIMVFAD